MMCSQVLSLQVQMRPLCEECRDSGVVTHGLLRYFVQVPMS